MAALELVLANRILKNKSYQQEMASLRVLEEKRRFCKHDLEHCLSVARIAMLLCTEYGVKADPDTVYAAALLHDLGRVAEYTQGIPHQEAGSVLAAQILSECDCDDLQKQQILHLIACHRSKPEGEQTAHLFYLADKRSRTCFACPAQDECNWQPEKRTMEIKE